jgi:hypothetical protein
MEHQDKCETMKMNHENEYEVLRLYMEMTVTLTEGSALE